MNDTHFKELLAFLGMSWDGYRRVRKGVKKRIIRHMQKLNCREMSAYLKELSINPAARQTCDFLMTVSISRFFRDYPIWKVLENEILPSFSSKMKINVWSAGCACGEEAYSINIIGNRFRENIPSSPQIAITASDLKSEYIGKALIGQYSPSSLREVPSDWRERYFYKVKGRKWFEVKEYLKKGIRWKAGTFDSPMSCMNFDIIFLRNNLLTYYLNPEKEMVFHSILNRLASPGWLITGAREKLPVNSPSLKSVLAVPGIFYKC